MEEETKKRLHLKELDLKQSSSFPLSDSPSDYLV